MQQMFAYVGESFINEPCQGLHLALLEQSWYAKPAPVLEASYTSVMTRIGQYFARVIQSWGTSYTMPVKSGCRTLERVPLGVQEMRHFLLPLTVPCLSATITERTLIWWLRRQPEGGRSTTECCINPMPERAQYRSEGSALDTDVSCA